MIETLDCAGKPLDLGRPCVMGVLNVTPDSFSDGGRYRDPEAAIKHARRMVEAGAALIDVGGESTRPGAAAVTVEEELARVIPVIEAIAPAVAVPISVDTSKPEVMRAAADAGAGLINDVMALREEGALQAALATGLPVCLMHMQGRPRSMQEAPRYVDVVDEVKAFLAGRVEACVAAGFERERLLIDPGFGFGKTVEHNLTLLDRLEDFLDLDLPLLVGLSRKSTLGHILGGAPPDRRLHASVAAGVIAALKGALIIRAHDVAETLEALKLVTALQQLETH